MQAVRPNLRLTSFLRRATKTPRRSFAQETARPAPVPPRRSFPLLALGGIVLGTSAYTVGSVYPPTVLQLLYPRPSPPSPDADSPEGLKATESIERQLQELDIVKELRQKQTEYYETRPYQHYPEEKRIHSLTAGTLRGPGKFAVTPLIFAKWDETESIVIVHVGRSLCGHDGIIHGGLLATMLDEILARVAFMHLPSHVGVTANLNLNYKAPTKADQFIVIKTKLQEIKGRKATILGEVQDLQGKTLVQASGLFLEPKYANMLKVEGIEHILGVRPKQGHPIAGVDVAITS